MKMVKRAMNHTKNQKHKNIKGRITNIVGDSTNNIGDTSWINLFASKTLARLITFLLTRSDESFYQKELMDCTGANLYVVQRELKKLENAEIITKESRGNRVYYSANRNHPAFEDLKRVILKTLWLGESLRAALHPLKNNVQFAFIYGSFASGKETFQSDIDLLIIGELTLRESSAILGPVGRRLGREFNPTIYTPVEFQRKAKNGNHFITEVLESKKIFLIGNEHDLRKLTD